MNSLYPKIRTLTVYCGSQRVEDPAYDQAATELAEILAANGITLVYGGSGIGTMKVLADAMLAQGGKVVGVFTKSLREEELHPGLTETIVVENLAARKTEMIRRCDAIVALPGSFGTLDELFDAVAMRKMDSGGHHHPIGILNVNKYYDDLLAFLGHTVDVGYTSAHDAELVLSALTPATLLEKLNVAVKSSGRAELPHEQGRRIYRRFRSTSD